MAVMGFINQVKPRCLVDMHIGAVLGAAAGAATGILVVGGVGLLGKVVSVVEPIYRMVGMESRCAIYSDDCQSQQLRDHSVCYISASSLASTVISATAICGALVGMACGVAKNVFGRPHSA